jgi:hypothetical protein
MVDPKDVQHLSSAFYSGRSDRRPQVRLSYKPYDALKPTARNVLQAGRSIVGREPVAATVAAGIVAAAITNSIIGFAAGAAIVLLLHASDSAS